MALTTTDKSLSDIIQLRLESQGDLSEVRANALAEFRRTGLPGTRHEEFKHTPLTRELEKIFTLSEPQSNGQQAFDFSEYSLPIEANVIVIVNGVFSRERSKIVSPASELIISDLASAERSIEDVKFHLGKYANTLNDGYTSWNTAGWNEGLFIRVARNIKLSHPVVIHHIGVSDKESFIPSCCVP